MSLFPLGVGLVPHTVARTSQGLGSTTVTTGGTPHVKTAWIQVTPNTAADSYLVRVYIDQSFVSATDTSTLLDIAVGNLGTEVVVVANLLIGYKRPAFGGGTASSGVTCFDIPIFIPAGTRVAVRMQSALLSTAFAIAVDFFGTPTMLGDPPTGQAIDTYGALTASSHGTAVAAGTNGAAGSWTQISASTTAAYRAFIFGVDGNGSTDVKGGNAVFDIGVGASSAEVSILPAGYIQVSMSSTESVDLRTPLGHLVWLPQSVPAGSRLCVRCSLSSATAQSYGVALYGVR